MNKLVILSSLLRQIGCCIGIVGTALALFGCSSGNGSNGAGGTGGAAGHLRDSGASDSSTSARDSAVVVQDSGVVIDSGVGVTDAAIGPVDAAVGAEGCNSPTLGAVATCTSYPEASITSIRHPSKAGCYELSHVGLIARTDSSSEPRLYVQDKNGGDYSAIVATCSQTAAHPCSSAVAAKIPRILDSAEKGARLSVRGYYEFSKVSGFEEFYVEDVIDECKALPKPLPISLTVADLAEGARVPAKWFSRAIVDVPATNPLVAYDFSPAELALTGPCPKWGGFALISKSAGATSAAGCSGAVNPAGQASDANEILIGRQFFKTFLYSSDCGCTAGTQQRLITAASSLSGSMLGILVIEENKGSSAPFQLFEPVADKTFPLE